MRPRLWVFTGRLRRQSIEEIGRCNEPAYVRETAEAAQVRSVSLEVVAAQATANAVRLFRI